MEQTPLPNTFRKGSRLFTRSLLPGKKHFEQEWLTQDGKHREFSPKHSKLAAALMKGCQQFGMKEGAVILYLGASHGYTPSFVSDMIGLDGTIFCVEFSPSVGRDLVFLCEERENMIPLLADARRVDDLAPRITACDVVFQDIAQPDQADIFLRNVRAFLLPGGTGMLALKARSVDASRRPAEIFKETRKRFEREEGIVLVDYRELAPFEKDHAFFVVKRK